MLFNTLTALAGAAALFSSVQAIPTAELDTRQAHSTPVVPTEPDATGVFKAGGTCTMQWTAGTGTAWKDMTIEFMTGSNLAMVSLATIATGIDGTDSSSNTFSWTCPEVSIYSRIYFYQFTTANGTGATWTTRWTLEDANGNSVTEPNQTQDGEDIPWGTGALLSTVTTSEGGATSSSSDDSTIVVSGSSVATSGGSSAASTTSAAASSSASSSSTRSSSTKSSTQSSSSSAQSTSATSEQATSQSSTTSGAASVGMLSVGSAALMAVAGGMALLL